MALARGWWFCVLLLSAARGANSLYLFLTGTASRIRFASSACEASDCLSLCASTLRTGFVPWLDSSSGQIYGFRYGFSNNFFSDSPDVRRRQKVLLVCVLILKHLPLVASDGHEHGMQLLSDLLGVVHPRRVGPAAVHLKREDIKRARCVVWRQSSSDISHPPRAPSHRAGIPNVHEVFVHASEGASPDRPIGARRICDVLIPPTLTWPPQRRAATF